ncbi:MAG TPA: beta-galactosidase [Candidatus Dormibacteraeota bacterium]
MAALGVGALAVPVLLEARVTRSERAAGESFASVPVAGRGSTLLGISFRPRQAAEFGLDGRATLARLLESPFSLVRVAAYWNSIEARPGVFDFRDLDSQLDAVERAGKRVIVAVGAVKNFGYPEFFVPPHRLDGPLPEGRLVSAVSHPALLAGAVEFVSRVAERYRDRASVLAWQLEHEAVDPLGVEHSWRLGVDFVAAEMAALRRADPSRPVIMNGFLPTSTPVRVSQWWRTRDQGDSLAVAARIADIVGIDYYPRHALAGMGSRTVYMDGAATPWQRTLVDARVEQVRRSGKMFMVTEGQSEPWEAVTAPPSPRDREMFSCRAQHLLTNYNETMRWSTPAHPVYAYLFWGAEYWVLRDRDGDSRYMRAFERVLEES